MSRRAAVVLRRVGAIGVLVLIAWRGQETQSDPLGDAVGVVQSLSPGFQCTKSALEGVHRRACFAGTDSIVYDRSTQDTALLNVVIRAPSASESRRYSRRLLDQLARRGWQISSCGTAETPAGHAESSLLVNGSAAGVAVVIESSAGSAKLLLLLATPPNRQLEGMCSRPQDGRA